MGGHVAEKLIIGSEKISSGCGSDLQGATNLAYSAVRQSGMFGELASYLSSSFEDSSDNYNAQVDRAVKKILDVSWDQMGCVADMAIFLSKESYERVKNVLTKKDKELRRLSKALYE